MNNNLKSLLIEYDQKRSNAINKANLKKEEFYSKHSDVEKIDNEIKQLSIDAIKFSLLNDKEKLKSINKEIQNAQVKRNNLVEKYGANLKDFNPQFECKKCKDTGYVSTESGNELCSCIKQKLYNLSFNESNIYNLKNQCFDNFDLNVYSNKVDKEKYNSSISPRENINRILKSCHNFIDNFDDAKENNLLFCGNTGLGKTFLSSCIANELIKKGKVVLYQTAPIMLDKIIDYKFGKSDDDIVKSIYNADLLIIDDLGSETKNNLKITELFNIINSRLLNQNNKITKTIISTNLSLQDLYDTYEERIVSRIIGNYNACYFYGEDIRLQKKLVH